MIKDNLSGVFRMKKHVVDFKSIKTRLLIFILGIIILSNFALGFIAYARFKPALGKSVQETLTTISGKVAAQVSMTNDKVFHMLEVLASTEVLSDDSYAIADKIEFISGAVKSDPSYISVLYITQEGLSYNEYGDEINFSANQYFQKALNGTRVVTDPAIREGAAENSELVMNYFVPVYSDYKITGVLAAEVNGQKYSDLCASITIGEDSHPFIIDMVTGRTVADPDPSFVKKGQILKNSTKGEMNEAIVDAMAGNTSYHSFFEPWRKKVMVASYRPVGDSSNWAVFCMAPYREYFGVIDRIVNWMIVVLIVILIISVTFGTLIIARAIKPLRTVEDSISEIANGNADLTKRIEVTTEDEIGRVVEGFNKFSEKLQTIISHIKHSRNNLGTAGENMSASSQETASSITEIIANIQSVHKQITSQSSSVEQTAGAVNEIASNISSLEKMIEKQSAGVSNASSAVEQMIGNIASVNLSMDKMASSFNELQENAQTGSAKQADVNAKIEQIEQQSQMLQEANAVIASIAQQTNLLAMNAAIEAAHAGEAGRGFSVVADEIRKLSETSTSQSKTIGEQLKSIQDSIDSVVSASEESSTAFQSVSDKIRETDELVRQIKAAMEEQTAGSRQIGDSLHEMNDSTSEVRTASREMAEGNKLILEEVRHLQDATSVMLSSMDEMSIGAKKINETGTQLHEITQKMNSSIIEISEQIDQFKV